MKIHKLTILMTSLILIIGCASKSHTDGNRIIIPSSEGTSYLDASREVILNQNWTHLGETGRTTNGVTIVTITGGSAEGKKVYFTLQDEESDKSSLAVVTESDFPMPQEQILALVTKEHDK